MTIKDFRTPRGRDMGPGRIGPEYLSLDHPVPGVPLGVAMHELGDGMAPRCPLCGTTNLNGNIGCTPTLAQEPLKEKNAELRAAGIRQAGHAYLLN
jgi:hypothetical protein